MPTLIIFSQCPHEQSFLIFHLLLKITELSPLNFIHTYKYLHLKDRTTNFLLCEKTFYTGFNWDSVDLWKEVYCPWTFHVAPSIYPSFSLLPVQDEVS